jgi:hypothetical protein
MIFASTITVESKSLVIILILIVSISPLIVVILHTIKRSQDDFQEIDLLMKYETSELDRKAKMKNK